MNACEQASCATLETLTAMQQTEEPLGQPSRVSIGGRSVGKYIAWGLLYRDLYTLDIDLRRAIVHFIPRQ